jgi:hypothetical protein
MSRRALQIVLFVLSLVPIVGSVATIVLGADRFTGAAAVPAEVDHALRYLSGVYLGVGLILWYAIPRVEREGALLAVLAGCVFLGGVARLVSVLDVGASSPLQYGLIALELAVPLLIPWQRRVAREGTRRPSTRVRVGATMPR